MRNEGGEKNGCFDNCSHEQYRHGAPRHRGDFRRDHRARVPGDARQIRHQARARLGLLARLVVGVCVAVAAFLGVAAPTQALAAVSDLVNTTPGVSSVAMTALPDCTDAGILPAGFYVGNSDGRNQQAAVDLGWVGKPHIAVTDYASGVQAEIAPQIPCTLVGEGSCPSACVEIPYVQNVFGSTPATSNLAFAVDAIITCLVNGTPTDIESVIGGQNYGIRGGLGVGYGGRSAGNRVYPANCPAIQSVRMVVSLYVKDSTSPAQFSNPQTWVWQAAGWTTANGAWTPATSAGAVLPPGSENPIVCNINNSGADIIAVIQNVVTSTAAWFPCMLIPVGWDRGGKIPDAWNTGPMGTLVTAYKAAVPGGISCGPVGNLPFYGRAISFDTCGGDFMPGWMKVVVTYVMILGLSALAVRRIMWSVGSRG